MTDRKTAQPKTLPNGVSVPAGLTVNEMTCSEWVNRAFWNEAFYKLDRQELRLIAKRIGFSDEDIINELPLGGIKI